MSGPRIALVGARRVRQGLGPFVAAILAAEGARLEAFLGTSPASLEAARRDLAGAGIAARGYTHLEDLLAAEDLDALVILSPPESHEGHLRGALEAGLHVLCEKPLVWGAVGGGTGLGERAEELAAAFRRRGLLLAENCQWPHALPAFFQLHPEVRRQAPVRLAMGLTPARGGEAMIGDALPHPLSLVQALRPSPRARIEDLTFSTRDRGTEELAIGFRYTTPEGSLEASVELKRGDTLPREAWLTINGRQARRRVELAGYAQFLGSGAGAGGGQREVPLADPLQAHLRGFLKDLEAARGGRLPPSYPIPQRMRMLERALLAFLRSTPRGTPS